MSQNVGEIDLSLILNSDKFKSQLKNTKSYADEASSKISSSLSKIGKAVAVAFSVTKIVQFGKECLKVATETSNAWIGLNSILVGQGRSFDKAKAFVQEYVSDGLVPLNNAVAAYKNLTLRGYSSDQIEKTMNALKNSATFARQSTYTLGEAVQTATEGLKNENSVVVDNAGVTKNVAKMWEDYAKSIGKTTNQLTQNEKIQAEVNGILEETKFQSNDAAIYASTYSGKLAQLNTAFTNLKTAVGNAIQPIAKLFIPIITNAVNAVTKLFTALSGLLSLFGLKADSVETVSSGIGGLASSAEDASDAIEGIGDSAKSAGKDAKKASNNLAAFDNLNVLQKDDKSGSGSSSGGGSSGFTDTLDVSSKVEEDTSAFSGLIERVKELASIFKEGFDISFGNTNFDGIKKHLQSIKEMLKSIWTDPDVVNAAHQWVNTCAYVLGQSVGAIARIGVNIAEGFVGSIDNYLTQNVDRIKEHLCTMFDISIENMTLTGNLMQALGEISDVLSGDTAKQIGADLISIFTNPLMSVVELLSKFVVDLKAIFVQPIIDNVDKIKIALGNMLQPIETVLHTIGDAFTYVGDKWNEIYDNHIHPLMDSLKTGLSDTFSRFLDVYNEYVAPALQRMADKFTELWEQHLKPLADKFSEFMGKVYDLIKVLWENIVKPFIDWLVENILPILIPIFENTWNTLCTLFGAVADGIKSTIDILIGIIDFLITIFSTDWKQVWEDIKIFFVESWENIRKVATEIINNIKEYIETKLEQIKTTWQNIWNAIKTFFTDLWNAIKTTVTNLFNSIKDFISDVLNNIQTIWQNIWNAISTFFTNIWNELKSTVTNIFNAIKDFISNILDNIKTTFTNVWNSIKETVTNILETMKTTITNIWNNIKTTITDVINNVKSTISNVINNIQSIWTNVWSSIQIIASAIWNNITGTISNVINGIRNTISNVLNSIQSVWTNVFNGLKNTTTNIFNGIWKSIKGVINSILGGIESMANGVINGINGMIDSLNSVRFDIPDWVPMWGGKSFGLSLGKIGNVSLPRLAEGGYVKANTPQLAMIGDNKTQGEIVAPENKMLDMILTALKMQKEQETTINQNGNTIVLNFDGSLAQLVRLLKPELDREATRRGDKLVIGGAS